MPAYTYQVAVKEDEAWFRHYVCADSKEHAVFEFLEEFPPLSLEFLLQADEFHVERCD